MSAVFQHAVAVPVEAIDENNHVNNVVYVQWMQDAAVHHSDSVGCTEKTRAAGASWVVRAHRIEYLRPAFAGDELVVQTWVENFRKVRSLRKYRFIRRNDDVIVAEGETDWVFVDTQTGRPRSIPGEVSACFVLLPGGPGKACPQAPG